jgi:hypothetical protein
MRFTLRDLFVAVTFCAVIAWSAAQAGFDSIPFWIYIGAAGLMSVLFVMAVLRKRSGLVQIGVVVPFVVLSFMLVSPPLLINAALLAVIVVPVAKLLAPSPRALASAVAAVMLAALGFGLYPGISATIDLRSLREEFPVVSLGSRLEYEKRARRTLDGWVTLGASPAAFLSFYEANSPSRTFRHFQLQLLHDKQYERFVRARGFGVSRMHSLRPQWVRLPLIADISFSGAIMDLTSFPFDDAPRMPLQGDPGSVEILHEISHNDFLAPDSFGYLFEPLKFVGFTPHAFRRSPFDVARIATDPSQLARLTLDRLELVSLLKFDGPRAYVLDHLPRMDQLSSDNAPTRPLDAFESVALEQLRTKEDVVVEHNGDQYRMLGSLRAAKQCLDCHSVQRGELLGAFSYVLREKAR